MLDKTYQFEDPETEIRAITRFLCFMGLNSKQIHDKFSEITTNNTKSERTIANYLKQIKNGTFSIYKKTPTGRHKNHENIQKVHDYIESDPYACTRKIAKKLEISKDTVRLIHRNDLNMTKINFKYIPYKLSASHKEKRVEIAQELLDLLSKFSPKGLNKVLTEDETWIYFENERKSIWLENGFPIPKLPKKTIASKKAMFAITWSRSGIKSVTMLGQNQKFN